MATAAAQPQVGYPSKLHEWVPPELWVETFGEKTRTFAEMDFHNLKGMKNRYLRMLTPTCRASSTSVPPGTERGLTLSELTTLTSGFS